MMTRSRRWVGLVILIGAAALGLVACNAASTNAPRVASLGARSSDSDSRKSTTTALKAGNPTQLMDQWAACMRSNGDPNQTDPTIDAYGVINITIRDVSQVVAWRPMEAAVRAANMSSRPRTHCGVASSTSRRTRRK